MSSDGVIPDEMDDPVAADDAITEALCSGSGQSVDPELARVLDAVRAAYTTVPTRVGQELADLMAASAAVNTGATASALGRCSRRRRGSIVARFAVAVAVLVSATGSLAVAHALPAPMQNAVSQLGIGRPASPSHKKGPGSPAPDGGSSSLVSSVPLPATATPSTSLATRHVGQPDSNRSGGFATARGGGAGCAHGYEVSANASAKAKTKSCATTTVTTTPTGPAHKGNGLRDGKAQANAKAH